MKLKLLTHPYFWRELKYKIRDYFFPRNKWLFKKIGNGYCDSYGLVDIVLFEILVHFVEVEKGLDSILNKDSLAGDIKNGYFSEDYRNQQLKIREELEIAYDYIKNQRPALQKKHDASYPKPLTNLMDWFIPCKDGSGNSRMLSCEERYGMPFEEAYGEMIRIDKEIEDADTHTMFMIVSNRKYLWT